MTYLNTKYLMSVCVIALTWLTNIAHSKDDNTFLGLTPPQDVPIVLAPEIISLTEQVELNAVFHPNGKEFYFCRRVNDVYRLFVIKKHANDNWSLPERVHLKEMDDYEIVDPWISPDGQRMIYISNAPTSTFAKGSVNLWVMQREGDTWGAPKLLPAPINSNAREIYPVYTNSGNLYFSSTREGGLGGYDIYVAKYVDGQYQPPENLGKPVNSAGREGDVFVAPDESYLIVAVGGRDDTFGKGDLYISHRSANGKWGNLKNLGQVINTKEFDFTPTMSPNGKYFFFTTDGDIRWVSSNVIFSTEK
ncbi:TolB-like translocation protein [Kordiimonas aquimaris]|uniref:hypothetical protein n=1 Tax=Kordiimonas aquimaris TaxID=707591 RepID=UPI0021D350ED|nr:hypothetical protein [Kordiimonas aquimaris]